MFFPPRLPAGERARLPGLGGGGQGEGDGQGEGQGGGARGAGAGTGRWQNRLADGQPGAPAWEHASESSCVGMVPPKLAERKVAK